MKPKHLNAKGKGEVDYDYTNDILFFKVKERTYDHSIELEDFVLDVDNKGYITGIQIFGASKIFNIEKGILRNIKEWEFKVKTEGKIISVQLFFKILRRNEIVERGQNLIREATSLLTDSEVKCAVTNV